MCPLQTSSSQKKLLCEDEIEKLAALSSIFLGLHNDFEAF